MSQAFRLRAALRALVSRCLFVALGLAFAHGAQAASVSLAWDAVSGASLAGYTVHWGTASGSYPAQVDVGNTTSRTISGLNEGTTYYFAVTAFDASGARSGYSNEASTTIAYVAPVANFTANATSGSAPLAVSFTSTSTGSISAFAWTFGDGTTSTLQNPTKTYSVAGTYSVSLTVTGPGGSNAKTASNYISVAAPVDTTAPSAPSSISAAGTGSTAINLSWGASTDNVGVTGYRVERCQGAGCTSFAQVATPSGTTFGDTTLTASTSYSYRVRAIDAAGNLGPYSTTASATTATLPDTTAPSAPTGLAGTVAATTVNLTWVQSTDNVAVAEYRVERCQGSSTCTNFAPIGTSATNAYADTGRTAGTTYRYRVRAADDAGNVSGASNRIALTATAPVLAPVASFSATPVSGTAPLTVTFTSTSTGSITTYAWSFGDGTTSSVANPSKIYTTSGTYAVSLTVTGPGGSHTATQTAFVTVAPSPAVLQNMGLLIDYAPVAGAVSNGNGILEPGETVVVAPMWQLTAGAAINVTATAQVSGQGGESFGLGDNAAAYGTLLPGSAVDCQSATGNCYLLSVAKVMKRPTLKWGVTFTETLSTGTVVTRTIPIGKTFADVADNDVFYPMIEALVWNDVTMGYADGTFQSANGVTRMETAIFLARAAARGEPAIPSSGTVGASPYNCTTGGVSLFADVAPTDVGCKQVHYLANRQVNMSSECSGTGNVCPTNGITRGIMAVEVAGAMATGGDAGVPMVGTFNDSGTPRSYNCAVTGGGHFPDVPSSASYCRHINYLWARGVIDGFGDGTFHPEYTLTRGQMAKFVANAFRLRVQ